MEDAEAFFSSGEISMHGAVHRSIDIYAIVY